MFPLWNDVVAPVIDAAGARRIVEVGALRGENTELMLERMGPDVELHVIDPVPEFDPAEHEARFGGRYVFHRDLSVNVLGELPPMDVALLDGDHNWYTVISELRLLAEVARRHDVPLPVCIMHDVGWPYGRRDLYYDPDNIPEEHRQPWRRAGIRRGQSELGPDGSPGMNAELANADHEGGPHNGVMTGVEDFVAEHDRELRLVVLPIYYGLAILVEEAVLAERPALAQIIDRLEAAGNDDLLRLAEDIRLDAAAMDQILIRTRDRRIDRVTDRYLDTVKAAIVNDHHLEDEARLSYLLDVADRGGRPDPGTLADPVRHAPELVQRLQERHRVGAAAGDRVSGDWGYASTGRLGLDHVHRHLDRIWEGKVPGDVAVCGVARGAAVLLAAAFLEAHDADNFPNRRRKLWVLDRFRRSDGGIDLNLMRDRLARFDLLLRQVRLLQGEPLATADDLADGTLAMLVLGPGLDADVDSVLARLFPRLAPGGVLVVEPGDAALVEAIEAFRARLGSTGHLERGEAGGLAWTKAEPVGEPSTSASAPPTPADHAPLVRPTSMVAPDLSVVVIIHNMRREAARSLHSLSPAYQRGMDGRRYEVIVVENGSDADQRLGPEPVEALGRTFRYLDMGDGASPSPVAALNRGLAESRGRNVALMIDGAHVLTPRVLHYGLAGLEAYEPAVVATQAWYVGPGQQGDVMRAGYDQGVEDALFDQIAWPADGYRLFEIGHFAGDRDWFDGLWESNCLFAPRTLLEQVGGFDEGFAEAGGGFTNLEMYERLASTPSLRVVTILGEGSFHQVHGGTTTNRPDPVERRQRIRSYAADYAERRGRPFMGPEKPIQFVGGFHSEFAKRSRARRMTGRFFDVDARLEGADGPPPASPIPVPDDLRDAFTTAYHNSLAWKGTRWLGHPVDNAPTDLVVYQEIIDEVRPDWIIETGAPDGGRAWFLASICEMVGHGEVISISPNPGKKRPEHDRVRLLAAVPHETSTVDQVKAIVGDEPHALVILGSRTKRDRTRREFEAFAPLVPVGSYVVVEHTVLNGFPVDASFGPGPHDALRRLMNLHDEFLADSTRERHALTFNQGGFLRRIS